MDGSPSLLSSVDNILTSHSLLYHLYLLLSTLFLPLTEEPFSNINANNLPTNWTHLPTLSPYGSKKRSPTCSGCRLPFDTGTRLHKCLFATSGFKIKNQSFRPCQVFYHAPCIKVGSPFHSRHYGEGTNGLQYPPCATVLPFICELCTTRTHLGRELDALMSSDLTLLMLERMRMIDAAHAWAPRTLENACRTLRRINKFFISHSLPPLHTQLDLPSLSHPPIDISIPLFWSMIHYTSTPSSRSQNMTPTWNTGRAQRSALSVYSAWAAAFCFPQNCYKDDANRLLSSNFVSPSDNILCRFTAGGISSRLGTESRPSQALVHRHIQWNQKYRAKLLVSLDSLPAQYDLVAAQCVELLAWLGWLRASEIFNVRMSDVEMIPPPKGAAYNLPPNVGAILLRLLPSTKASRNKQVDVVMAWKTSSGFSLGSWLSKLFTILRQLKTYSPNCYLFHTSRTAPWTSNYFRTHHLYPLLHLQYLNGDATLRHINITSTHDIPYYFFSMHSYRRGAETHCSRKRAGCVRAALAGEAINHARWRIKNKGREDMPTHYREPSVEDRVYLTLLCF